jgi:hypothetical protein
MADRLAEQCPTQIRNQLLTDELRNTTSQQIHQSLTDESEGLQILAKNRLLTDIFKVSWTHYVVLTSIKNDAERRFYELEAAKNGWAVEDLKRQYVHYFDRYVKTDDENPTVGILICGKKDDAIVELTLPEGENIYASEYSLYLPDKNLLQSKLAQWIEEFEEVQTVLKIAEGGADE